MIKFISSNKSVSSNKLNNKFFRKIEKQNFSNGKVISQFCKQHNIQKNISLLQFQKKTFSTDDSGFHADFKSIRKKYEEKTHSPEEVKKFIKEVVETNPVVIFMKGSPDAPKCGFSAIACRLLKEEGVKNIKSIDVLEDDTIREGIKDYTGWKTIPQVFINQEFIGGADIIKEMFQSGQLTEKLKTISTK